MAESSRSEGKAADKTAEKDDKAQQRQQDQEQQDQPQADPDALGRETGVHAVPDDSKDTLRSLLANEAVQVEDTRQSDPLHGEHEAQPGELLPHDELNARADRQRYEAQKDEPLEYPGDSGLQAKARLDAAGNK
jgi:hypothetical protein